MPKVILFDVDGTLVKAGGSGRRALNRALEKLYGKREICSQDFLAGSTDKDNFKRSFIEAAGKTPTAKDIKLIEKTYLELLPSEVDAAVREKRYLTIKGVENFLSRLSRRKDIFLGLGTGNIEEGARLKLAPSGLWDYFRFGGFGCDGYERVAVLETAVKRAGKICGGTIKPSQVYIVGDTEKDVYAGKQAGYHTAAVTAGYGSPGGVMRSAPELLSEDFSDVEMWLMWLGLNKNNGPVERGCFMFPNSAIEHVQHGRTGDDAPQTEKICPPRKR
ncbi:MAG: HAD family hydrolase [Elusimicrobiaceae bacterium]